MSDIQTKPTGCSGNGSIRIADEVVAIIAGTAAQEVEGVAASVNLQSDLAETRGRRNLAKGVKIHGGDGSVDITVSLSVKNGFNVSQVSQEVQKKVKTAVETMTALFVTGVDVDVVGVTPER